MRQNPQSHRNAVWPYQLNDSGDHGDSGLINGDGVARLSTCLISKGKSLRSNLRSASSCLMCYKYSLSC